MALKTFVKYNSSKDPSSRPAILQDVEMYETPTKEGFQTDAS